MGEKNSAAGDTLHSGHRQRLKKRFIENGLQSFEDHNVLELLLFYSKPRVDTNETAHLLLKKFGSLSNVFEAPYEMLTEVNGMGPESAALIKLIPELTRRYLTNKASQHAVITNADEAVEYLRAFFVGKTDEIFIIVSLDGCGNVKNTLEIPNGTASSVFVNMSSIFKEIISVKPAGIVLAHNHPQGFAVPSQSDVNVTKTLSDMLRDFNVRVCDHIIFSSDDCCCFSKLNRIDCGNLAFLKHA